MRNVRARSRTAKDAKVIALEAWKRVLGCQFDRVAHHAITLPHVLDGEPQKVDIAFDLASVRFESLADIAL